MFRSGRTWISRTLIILFTSFALIISQSCYAADDDDDNDHRFGFAAFDCGVLLDATIALVVPAAIAVLAFTSLIKKSEASTPAPVPCGTVEVVYKDTTTATYSYPGETHTDGKLTIKNNSSNTAQFVASITPDSAGKANIKILPSSSCLSPVAAGATCSYNFSYSDNFPTNGSPPSIVRAETLINIKCYTTNELLLSFPIESYFPSFYWFLAVPANITGFNKLPTNSITSVFCQDDTVYVSINDVGIGISHDHGKSWSLYTPSQGGGLSTGYTTAVYVSGSNIYVGTSNLGVPTTGLSISTDNGLSWTTYLIGENVRGIYVSGSKIYAATDNGLQVSTNNGGSWTLYDSTTPGFAATNNVQAVYATGDFIYAATAAGLSVYNGTSAIWTTYIHGATPGFGGNNVKGVYVSGTTIYAATDAGLSINTNNGTGVWTTSTALVNGLGSDTVNGIYASGGYLYAATAGGVSISSDNGSSWVNRTTVNGLGGNYINGVYVCDGYLYAATTDGLSVSTNNGLTWTAYKSGGPTEVLFSYDVYVSGNNFYLASATDGLSVSNDGGLNWVVYDASNLGFGSNTVSSVYALGNTIYAGTTIGLLVSPDNGTNWNKYDSTTSGFSTVNDVSDVYAAGNNIYVATAGGGLSVYNGTSWHTYTQFIDGLPSDNLLAVHAVGSNVYMGTSGSGLAISTNNGAPNLAPPPYIHIIPPMILNNTVNDVYAVGSNIYVATDGGLSVSPDSGSTWASYTYPGTLGFPQDGTTYSVYAVGNSIYAGSLFGLGVSKNNGTNWTAYTVLNSGLPGLYVRGLIVDSGVIYVALYYGGMAMTKEPP